MKQSFVGAFAPAARLVALAAAGLALGAGTLLAQGSTGKIEGRVRDQAGAPIANAQVFVVGTAFNALTNSQMHEARTPDGSSLFALMANDWKAYKAKRDSPFEPPWLDQSLQRGRDDV